MNLRERFQKAWREYRLSRWAYSKGGAGYAKALDDVYDSLEPWNPCHDRVRAHITELRTLLR